MKARYRTGDGRIEFELEAENAKGLFGAIASIQEVFDIERRCGVCQCEDLKYQMRLVDDNDFYELVCMNQQCRARFSFGQHKKGGGLFPKRKDGDGNWIPSGGWVKWEGRQTDHSPESTTGSVPPPPKGAAVAPDVQKYFDKIANRLEVDSPMTLIGMLNLMREYLVRQLGREEGLKTFTSIQKRHEANHPEGIRNLPEIRALVSELGEAGIKE